MKYGFIGLGNMGSAILNGMLKSPSFSSEDIIGYDVDPSKLNEISENTGITACGSSTETVKNSAETSIEASTEIRRCIYIYKDLDCNSVRS